MRKPLEKMLFIIWVSLVAAGLGFAKYEMETKGLFGVGWWVSKE